VPKNWELTAGQLFWPLIVLLSILWMKIYRRKYLNLRLKYIFSELGLLIFLLLIIPLYLSYNIRYHSSPDNHGLGITTAYINNHFSYSYLANDFMGATGLDKPIFLGQKTPLLDSTWHILDTQLRFASDMVFTVGRIGFPVLAAVIGSQFQTIDAFSSFVLLLGIISMWCLGFLTLQLIKNLYSAISSIVANSGDNNGRMFRAINSGSLFTLNSQESVTSDFIFVRPRSSEFNYSENPSFVTGSTGEVLYSSFINNPQVYITTIGMYNDANELLAVAKLSRPLLKDFTKEALIRVKLDF
jgi:hypothetical protein